MRRKVEQINPTTKEIIMIYDGVDLTPYSEHIVRHSCENGTVGCGFLWRYIDEYPKLEYKMVGSYRLYSNGDMFNSKGQKLTRKQNHGHYCYDIVNENKAEYDKRKTVRVYEHNLLAQYFKPKEWFPYCLVHHINGDKKDNRLDNLQCLTMHEHESIHSEMKSKPVRCVETGEVFRSATMAMKIKFNRTDGAGCQNIKRAIQTNGTSYGFHWEYANKIDTLWEHKQVEYEPLRCIETGATFPHWKAVVLYIDRNRNEKVPSVSKKTMEYKGYHFEHISDDELGQYQFTYCRKPNAKKKRINFYWI